MPKGLTAPEKTFPPPLVPAKGLTQDAGSSEETAAEKIHELYLKRTQFSRLQEYRKRLGYTQAKLAEKSGVNLRTLQQYEVGDKDINKAAAGSVIALAKVLHCEPEELLEA